MNNFIANMDVLEKLMKYSNYKNIDVVDFEKTIETKYEKKMLALENNNVSDFGLHKNDLLNIINEVSQACHGQFPEHLNMIYDQKFNEIKFFTCGEWEHFIVSSGIKKLLRALQDYYLDSYECYLIRIIKRNESLSFKRNVARDHLDSYYRFIACFESEPFVKSHNDNEIMFSKEDDRAFQDCHSFDISEEFTHLYNKLKSSITITESAKINQDVISIFKKNSKRNIALLNKHILDMFHMDEEFKNAILIQAP